MGRAIFLPINDKFWYDFYVSQAKQTGHGINGFQGLAYQRGNGLGSFFGRLFRSILPVAKKIGKSVGREALSMGANVIGDLAEGKNIKASLKNRGLKASENLLNKAGSAIRNQSGGRIGKRKVTSKVVPTPAKRQRKSTKKPDIFENVKNN